MVNICSDELYRGEYKSCVQLAYRRLGEIYEPIEPSISKYYFDNMLIRYLMGCINYVKRFFFLNFIYNKRSEDNEIKKSVVTKVITVFPDVDLVFYYCFYYVKIIQIAYLLHQNIRNFTSNRYFLPASLDFASYFPHVTSNHLTMYRKKLLWRQASYLLMKSYLCKTDIQIT